MVYQKAITVLKDSSQDHNFLGVSFCVGGAHVLCHAFPNSLWSLVPFSNSWVDCASLFCHKLIILVHVPPDLDTSALTLLISAKAVRHFDSLFSMLPSWIGTSTLSMALSALVLRSVPQDAELLLVATTRKHTHTMTSLNKEWCW